MSVFEFKGFIPVIDPTAFIHPNATVTGNVIIGKDVYIGPGAAIRGDWGGIVIEDGCNVQENCTIHMFPGTTVFLRESAHIGHGAIIHGATIGKNALIGMNSVIMDDVVIGEGAIVGALSFVPAKIIKDVSDKMIDWKTKGTQLYQSLPQDCRDSLRPCEPLTEIPENRPTQESLFQVWEDIKNKK